MKQANVAVAIPVYKPGMSDYERISFLQCRRVLDRRDLVLLAPEGLDVAAYTEHRPDIAVSRFAPEYFRDIAGYNRLMLSRAFYDRFAAQGYDFLLIHQLDAFVFSDQLDYWCAQNYGYVGAPWIGQDDNIEQYCVTMRIRRWLPFWDRIRNRSVGNGGLSLRHIRAFSTVLRLFQRKAEIWGANEDFFWGLFASAANPFFRIPPFETALRFAFEVDPAECYARTDGRLPFGCHAWERYDLDFWRPIIREQGYDL